MDYQNRHVVVTGGTGALGTAVIGTLLAAGAVCHVPYYEEGAKRFAHRNHKQVSLVPLGNLADELAVTAFYSGLNTLWASIHIAGAFAFAPIAQSDKSLLTVQLESNLISAYLCSRSAVGAFRRGPGPGRIVNVAARQGFNDLNRSARRGALPNLLTILNNRKSEEELVSLLFLLEIVHFLLDRGSGSLLCRVAVSFSGFHRSGEGATRRALLQAFDEPSTCGPWRLRA